jgi:hypothetical protein
MHLQSYPVVEMLDHTIGLRLLSDGLNLQDTDQVAQGHPESALQRKSDLCIPIKSTVLPHSQFLHSYICEQFRYPHGGRSIYFPAAK